MDEILEVLAENARLTADDIAKLTGRDAASVRKAIKKYEKDGVIVKYKTLINRDLIEEADSSVRAIIEVSITPQKDVGFDQLAERIYSFSEVKSCYLLSGTYDLLVVVEGKTLRTVSDFIASKLAPLANVRATTTHFMLKKYKEDGHILKVTPSRKRLNISY